MVQKVSCGTGKNLTICSGQSPSFVDVPWIYLLKVAMLNSYVNVYQVNWSFQSVESSNRTWPMTGMFYNDGCWDDLSSRSGCFPLLGPLWGIGSVTWKGSIVVVAQ